MGKLAALIIIALSVPTHEQGGPISPCPNVFEYEPPGTEPERWYGVVHINTDSTLHALWLNIVLDGKADILGNWVGDVTTQDNIDFKIENTQMKINPGAEVSVRFFVQYNTLNKAPRLQAIRLNGREICNSNSPQPALDRPEDSSKFNRTSSKPGVQYSRTPTQTTRPQNQTPRPQVSSKPQTHNIRTQRPDIRPEDIPQSKPVQGRPATEGPVYVRPQPNPSNSYGEISSQTYALNSDPQSFNGIRHTTTAPQRTTTQRRDDVLDFVEEPQSNNKDGDYFTGGQPTIIIPNTKPGQCGKVLRNAVPLVVNGTPTLEGQWPWQIALYQTQTVDNKYICGGTLVSHRHVITAAHCITRKNSRTVVNEKTLTVYLGKHNLRTSVDGVQIKFVKKITVHPMYNASTFSRDVSILELRESVSYSEWVQPACLWPDADAHLNSVIGKKGSVVGWGFDETGVATEELSLVEMPVVDTETCIRSYSEFFVRFTSEYTYCAGFRDGFVKESPGFRKRTSVCNGDSGGGMVFKIGTSWYLRGLVSLSVARQNEFRCDPTHYVVFTDLAKFLPWIKENVYDY